MRLLIVIILSAYVLSCAGRTSEEAKTHYPLSLIQREMPGSTVLPPDKLGLYADYMSEGPVIPGLFNGAIPQGMAYWGREDTLFISNYMLNDWPGALTLISMDDQKQKKTLWLYNHDGLPHKDHLGGVAVVGDTLWIASGKYIYQLSLNLISEADDNAMITLNPPLFSEVKGSFAGTFEEYLIVGEFRNRRRQYQTHASHTYKISGKGFNYALMAAFKADPDSGTLLSGRSGAGEVQPDFFFSIPDEVQGAAFIDDHIVLSQSYGRRNSSRLSIYRSPLEKEPDDMFSLSDGSTVPVWILDHTNLVKVSTLPPMSEGIADYDNSLAVLFESGSKKYRRTAYLPQDRIHFLDLEFLDILN
ncbi:MAG: hypothetical protein R6V86_13950 [Spirochaetia bacterium]